MTNIFTAQMEGGVYGLHQRYWVGDRPDDWWIGFVQMAREKENGEFSYSTVPILVEEYVYAPSEWVMAKGTGGIVYHLLLVTYITLRGAFKLGILYLFETY